MLGFSRGNFWMNRSKKSRTFFSFIIKDTTFIFIIFFCLLFLFLNFKMTAYADLIKTFTPKITVLRNYRDLTDFEYKDSYWTTEISPGFSLELNSPKTQIDLDYAIGFSSFQNRNEKNSEDSTRHSLTTGLNKLLGRNTQFELSDTFVRSENPIMMYDEEVRDVLRERQIYTQNSGDAILSWQFGPGDGISLGYRNRYLDINSKSSDYEDSKGHEGFLTLDKRLNPKFSFGLFTSINRGKFYQQGESHGESSEDFYNFEEIMTLNYNWHPKRSFFIKYDSLKKDFDRYDGTPKTDDFWLHQGSIGFNLILSPNSELNLECGFFVKNPYNSKPSEGGTFSSMLTARAKNSTFTLQGSGGFREDYFSPENLGSSKFRRIFAIIQYNLSKYLRLNLFSGYNRDDFPGEHRKIDSQQIGTVFALNLKHQLTLDVEFLHWEKKEKTSVNQFEDIKTGRNNFVIITLRWNYPVLF